MALHKMSTQVLSYGHRKCTQDIEKVDACNFLFGNQPNTFNFNELFSLTFFMDFKTSNDLIFCEGLHFRQL